MRTIKPLTLNTKKIKIEDNNTKMKISKSKYDLSY